MSEAFQHEAPTIPTIDLPLRLKLARWRCGFEQKDMAARLGVHPRTVANYEGGDTEPKLGMLQAWAQLTNVPIDWLAFGITPEDGPTTRSRCFCGKPQGVCVCQPCKIVDEDAEIIDLRPPADIDEIIERLENDDYYVWAGGARILRFPTPPLPV